MTESEKKVVIRDPNDNSPNARVLKMPVSQWKSLSEDEQREVLTQFFPGDAPAPEETTQNPLSGAATNAKLLGANSLSAVDRLYSSDLSRKVIDAFPYTRLGGMAYDRIAKDQAQEISEVLRDDAEDDKPFHSRVSLDDVKDSKNPIQALSRGAQFGFDNLVASSPQALAGAAAAFGGPVTAATGASVLFGSESERIARERAERDGRGDEVQAEDLAVALPASAVNTALSRIPGAGAGLNQMLPANVKAALVRSGINIAKEAGTGALQGAVEEAAQGIGTDQGTSVDAILDNALAEGITGATGGTLGAAAIEGRRGAEAFLDVRSIGKEAAADNNQVLALQEAKLLIDQKREDTPGARKGGRADADRARQVADDVAKDLTVFVKQLKKEGRLPESEEASALVSDAEFAFNKADGDVLSNDFTGRSSPVAIALNQRRQLSDTEFKAVDRLGLEPETAEVFKQNLRVLDTLSQAGIIENTKRSDLTKSLAAAGLGTGTSLGLLTGGGFGGLGGLAAFGILGPAGAATGAAIGGAIGAAGHVLNNRNNPDVVKNAAAVNRIIARRQLQPENATRTLDSIQKDRAEAVKVAQAAHREVAEIQARELELRQKIREAEKAEETAKAQLVSDTSKAVKEAFDTQRKERKRLQTQLSKEIAAFQHVQKMKEAAIEAQAVAGTSPKSSSVESIRSINRLKRETDKDVIAAEARHRFEKRRRDPEGRYTVGSEGSFDALVQNDLRSWLKEQGYFTAQVEGGIGPRTQDRLLAKALAHGKITREDIRLFNENPKALMSGKRYVDHIRLALLEELDAELKGQPPQNN